MSQNLKRHLETWFNGEETVLLLKDPSLVSSTNMVVQK